MFSPHPLIHGLVVCVGYADQLALSIPYWLRGLASLTVVTTVGDHQTHTLCRECAGINSKRVRIYSTNAFTRDGAFFNKGLAMEEARKVMTWTDWVLFFDADIVPQPNWDEHLSPLDIGYLYGAWRLRADSPDDLGSAYHLPRIPDDRVGYGYFQLFHSQDPKVQRTPLLDTHWCHAGNADSNFLLSFGSCVRELPINLWHLGGPSENWFGIGKEKEFRAMMEKRGGQGIHPSERIR